MRLVARDAAKITSLAVSQGLTDPQDCVLKSFRSSLIYVPQILVREDLLGVLAEEAEHESCLPTSAERDIERDVRNSLGDLRPGGVDWGCLGLCGTGCKAF